MLKQTVAPVNTPISLAEAREELRLVHTDDDTLITSYIQEAVSRMDGYSGWLGKPMITQTWELTLPEFPVKRFLIDLEPVQSLSSISYYDVNNASQSFATSNVRLEKTGQQTFIVLDENSSWPSIYDRADAVTFTLVCGYGDDGTDLPENLRGAVRHYVYCRYEGMDMSEITSRVRTFIGPVRAIAL